MDCQNDHAASGAQTKAPDDKPKVSGTSTDQLDDPELIKSPKHLSAEGFIGQQTITQLLEPRTEGFGGLNLVTELLEEATKTMMGRKNAEADLLKGEARPPSGKNDLLVLRVKVCVYRLTTVVLTLLRYLVIQYDTKAMNSGISNARYVMLPPHQVLPTILENYNKSGKIYFDFHSVVKKFNFETEEFDLQLITVSFFCPHELNTSGTFKMIGKIGGNIKKYVLLDINRALWGKSRNYDSADWNLDNFISRMNYEGVKADRFLSCAWIWSDALLKSSNLQEEFDGRE